MLWPFQKIRSYILHPPKILVWVPLHLPRDELYPDVHGSRDNVGDVPLVMEALHRVPCGAPGHEHLGLLSLGHHQFHSLQKENVSGSLIDKNI